MRRRVLAVADSDSYLKWAAATLAGLGGRGELVLLASPVLPSPAQVDAAVAGTGAGRPRVVTLGGLVRALRHDPPGVLLVACTGPAARVVLALAARPGPARARPATVVGLPGWSLPASDEAVRLRRGADAFVVHSRAERAAFAPLLARRSPGTRLVLSRLPFLPDAAVLPDAAAAPGRSVPVRRVVFAPQALVPASPADRARLLDGLVALAGEGLDVVVKLRGRAGERQTHDERRPFDALAAARPGGAPGVRFVTGPLAAWLDPGTALVTVSSTAAVEALGAGARVALIDDFGVRDELLNTAFRGSGLLVGLADLAGTLAAGGPQPDGAWLDDHGLHPEPSELPGALGELAAQADAGALRGPVPPALRGASDLRALARLLAPARVAGSVRGWPGRGATPARMSDLERRSDQPRVVSASRTIEAPAARIFELIADPAQQPRWDGNDNLGSAVPGQRVGRVGDVFVMTLTTGATRENHVVEFEEGRRIAWLPAEPGGAPIGQLWRWELVPDGARTTVTHTYDWSGLTDEKRLVRARATSSERLAASVDRLAALAERADAEPEA